MAMFFHLNKKVNDESLSALNSAAGIYDNVGLAKRVFTAIVSYKGGTRDDNTHINYPTNDEFKNWIEAVESGEEIKNPESTEEKFRSWYNLLPCHTRTFVRIALMFISKEHPDVKDWIKKD